MLRKCPWSSFQSLPICLTWTDDIHLSLACPLCLEGFLYLSTIHWSLLETFHIQHYYRYKLLLIPFWHFFECRGLSVAEQPWRMKWVGQFLQLFCPVMKAVRKNRAVNWQSGPIIFSILAGNWQFLFQLFISNSICLVSTRSCFCNDNGHCKCWLKSLFSFVAVLFVWH